MSLDKQCQPPGRAQPDTGPEMSLSRSHCVPSDSSRLWDMDSSPLRCSPSPRQRRPHTQFLPPGLPEAWCRRPSQGWRSRETSSPAFQVPRFHANSQPSHGNPTRPEGFRPMAVLVQCLGYPPAPKQWFPPLDTPVGSLALPARPVAHPGSARSALRGS